MSSLALPVVDLLLDRRQLTQAEARAVRAFAEFRLTAGRLQYRQYRGRKAAELRAQRATGYSMGNPDVRRYEDGKEAIGALRPVMLLVCDGCDLAEVAREAETTPEGVAGIVKIAAKRLVQVYAMEDAE